MSHVNSAGRQVGDRFADVVDIRSSNGSSPATSLKNEIVECLARNEINILKEHGMPDITWSKSLPTMVLYEGQGLDLYEDITNYTPYYLYNDEISILRKYGKDIATHLLSSAPRQNTDSEATDTRPSPTSSASDLDVHIDKDHLQTIVDLGAGPLRKVTYLLDSLGMQALARTTESESEGIIKEPSVLVKYCAVDIQIQQLRKRLSDLLRKRPHFVNGCREAVNRNSNRAGKIAVHGICGSYNDAIELLSGRSSDADLQIEFKRQVNQGRSLLWLGSSFTNVAPRSAAEFLRQFVTNEILQTGDKLLIGIDRCQDVDEIKAAYCPGAECWRAYIRNGVKTAGMILGVSQLDGSPDWEYVARWDVVERKHVRFVRSTKSIRFSVPLPTEPISSKEIIIDEGEHILLAQSYKYSSTEAKQCFGLAGLDITKEWTNNKNDCSLYLLQRRITCI